MLCHTTDVKNVSAKCQFMSNLFLVKKKDEGNRPVISKWRACNHCGISSSKATSYATWIQSMHIFASRWRRSWRNSWDFTGRGTYINFCVYDGLAPAPYVFTKLFKVPIGFLRTIGTLVISYLDEMLLIGRTAEDVQMCIVIKWSSYCRSWVFW